jgi:Ca-activated chloride channel family protein
VAGAEARAHVGLLKFHLNQLDQAIEDLRAAAASTTDPFVQNLAWLVAGLAFEAQGRAAEATQAWRSAVAAVPAAKASATALAARLFLAGRRVEAAQIVGRAYRADPVVLDPWRRIAADIRFVPGYMAWLRASVGHNPGTRPAELPTFALQELIALRDPESAGGKVDSRVETEPAQNQPAFRATASMVAVPVSVRDRNVPVAGLTASDFELFDNGVRQTIQTLDRSPLPVDVSMVVDASNESNTFERGRYAGFLFVSQAARIKEDILATDATLLRPDDRIAVTLIGNEPWEVLRLDSTSGLPADRLGIRPLPLSYHREAALYDAVATRLVHVGGPDRRHLVIVFSSGLDDASVLTPDLLKAMAARTDAVVHVVRRSTVAEQRAMRGLSGALSSSLLWPADPKVIEDVAQLTGGQVFFRDGVGSLVEPIRRILDEFRQSYVLRYQPSGVSPGGWHEVTVRVSKPGGYDVKARRGYFGGE